MKAIFLCILFFNQYLLINVNSKSQNDTPLNHFIDNIKSSKNASELQSFFDFKLTNTDIDSLNIILKEIKTIGLDNIKFHSVELNVKSELNEGRIFNVNIYKVNPYEILYDLRVIYSNESSKIQAYKIINYQIKKDKPSKINQISFPSNPPPPPK